MELIARWMYSASFWAAFGFTENCSMVSGQPTPISSAENSISTVARAGDAQITQHDGGEERDGTDDRDRHQDELGRQDRIDVGVAGTRKISALR